MRNEKGQFVKGFKNGYEENLKLGRISGRKLTPEQLVKHSEVRKGMVAWNKGKKGLQVAHNKGKKGLQKAWNKGIPNFNGRGEKCHLWRGGITPINNKIRSSIEYKEWRKAVYERDNYTCVWCGDKTSGNLQADHIKPFSLYPELRLVVDNGRTLCRDCHKKTHSYMNRRMKKQHAVETSTVAVVQ